MMQALSIAKAKIDLRKRKKKVEANPQAFGAIEERIRLGDAVQLIKEIPDETFKIVLTDPPFGIEYRERKTSTDGMATAYEDSKESYEHILSMAHDIYRVIARDGWLLWFLGPTWWPVCKKTFESVGFTVDEIPFIWNRSTSKCYTARPDHYFARGYDMALHAFKGDPQMVKRGKANVITMDRVDNAERELLVERPVDLYAELLDRMTIAGEAVLDPFAGSGAVLAAAARRHQPYMGFELDPDRRTVAIQKVALYTPR
jgi:site-specific DNA-methyltransferase (adenine-specific)